MMTTKKIGNSINVEREKENGENRFHKLPVYSSERLTRC